MVRWHFGLDPSAIQNGAYPDFHRGQQAEFPVDLRLESCDQASGGPTTALRVEGSLYDLVARVEVVGDDAWVIDCGLLVGCRGRPPAGVEVGHWVIGRGRLALSPHPSERWADVEAPLTRTWFIERIHHRTEGDDLDLVDLGLFGGPEEAGWEELAFTDAWRDDEGRADYLLECLLVED